MANKAISELPQAQNVNNQDLFVLEQSGIAKKLTAETFITEQGIIDALAEALDGHGGIQSVTLQSLSGRVRTYRITFTDGSATTFQVLDGNTIERIAKTSEAGLVSTYTIFMSDGTTSFFNVSNGADGDVSEATLNSELAKKAPVIAETTASSAIANFTDGADDMVMHNIVADIEPVQDLSNGDPSPTNICPITGWTGVNVYHGTAYDADASAALTLSWTNEAGTVYGGTVDLATGLLTVTHQIFQVPTIAIWEASNNARYTSLSALGFTPSNMKNPPTGTANRTLIRTNWCKTNALKPTASGWSATASSSEAQFVISYDDYIMLNIGITQPTSAQINQFIADVGLQLYYPLATPQTYQLTPQEILRTLYGVNTVWADTGNVTVTYPADTKMYIDNAIAALA